MGPMKSIPMWYHEETTGMGFNSGAAIFNLRRHLWQLMFSRKAILPIDIDCDADGMPSQCPEEGKI